MTGDINALLTEWSATDVTLERRQDQQWYASFIQGMIQYHGKGVTIPEALIEAYVDSCLVNLAAAGQEEEFAMDDLNALRNSAYVAYLGHEAAGEYRGIYHPIRRAKYLAALHREPKS